MSICIVSSSGVKTKLDYSSKKEIENRKAINYFVPYNLIFSGQESWKLQKGKFNLILNKVNEWRLFENKFCLDSIFNNLLWSLGLGDNTKLRFHSFQFNFDTTAQIMSFQSSKCQRHIILELKTVWKQKEKRKT